LGGPAFLDVFNIHAVLPQIKKVLSLRISVFRRFARKQQEATRMLKGREKTVYG
jgi:hypothetical protein